jgi:UDP-2,4-diacetamido-2,4,6-trideoxy-beta-L-altropyranose hydrolase
MSSIAESAAVAIRVDASVEMGAGHLQRCLTLADALGRRGVRSTFVCRSLPDQFAEIIGRKGHEFIRLARGAGAFTAADSPAHAAWLGASQEQDARQTADALAPGPFDWLVVDHYAIDARWEAALRPFAKHILAIDDLADRPHDCDVLLDQNHYADLHDRYPGLVPPGCRQLLGPRYALLRPEFAGLRSQARHRDGKVNRVLVFFGGADAGNYTTLALEALATLGRSDVAVDVVVGLMNPHRSEIEATCAARANTRFFQQVEDMPRLMADADLALGAGGGATWERCCLGLPTLAIAVAENQRRSLNDLCRAGVVLSPSDEIGPDTRKQFVAMLETMVRCEPLLRGMSERGAGLVDGRGAERVAAAMLSTDVSLRLAVESDCERVYEWRNHPDVRSKSRQSAPIDYNSHAHWYAQALRDPNRLLLLAESAGRAVAVVRFDIGADCAEVSVYLAPAELAGGWGAQVLRRSAELLRQHHPRVRQIVAEILPDNLASRGAFTRAGYRETKVVFARSVP